MTNFQNTYQDPQFFLQSFQDDEILNANDDIENKNDEEYTDEKSLFVLNKIQDLDNDKSLTPTEYLKLNNMKQRDFKNTLGWDLFYALIERPTKNVNLSISAIEKAGYSEQYYDLYNAVLLLSAYTPDFHDIKSLLSTKQRNDLNAHEKKEMKKDIKKKEKMYITPKVISVSLVSHDETEKPCIFIEFERHLTEKEHTIYQKIYQNLLSDNYIVYIKDEYHQNDLNEEEKIQYLKLKEKCPSISAWNLYKNTAFPIWTFAQTDRYWQAAILASKLMTPKIIHLKNKCQNIRYKHDDDFEMAILETIFKALPEYDRSQSNFPKFIVPYMMQTAYVYENDLPEYSRQQLELFIDSYERQIENGENVNENTNFKTPDAIVFSQYDEEEFEKKCKIADIKYENQSFQFDHNNEDEVHKFMEKVQNYVICIKLFNNLYTSRIPDKLNEIEERITSSIDMEMEE